MQVCCLPLQQQPQLTFCIPPGCRGPQTAQHPNDPCDWCLGSSSGTGSQVRKKLLMSWKLRQSVILIISSICCTWSCIKYKLKTILPQGLAVRSPNLGVKAVFDCLGGLNFDLILFLLKSQLKKEHLYFALFPLVYLCLGYMQLRKWSLTWSGIIDIIKKITLPYMEGLRPEKVAFHDSSDK